ncbi:hypothetical protein D1007_28128 [Hordeum vulgare]|nr:hypothetical protein D1007_28128 [Hordeum vulgare]
MQIEVEIQALRAARIAAGLPSDSSEMEEDNEPEEENDTPGFNMTDAGEEFVVAQADKILEQRAILDSIRDDDEVEANRRLIR